MARTATNGGKVVRKSRITGITTEETKRKALKDKGVATIVIPSLELVNTKMKVVGDTDLIVHQFGAKSKKQMLDKQTGEASVGREKKNLNELYREAQYFLEDGKTPAFKCSAFKLSAVQACSSLKGLITQTLAKQSHRVNGTLTRLYGNARRVEDTVRLNGKTADIRTRAYFSEWYVILGITLNTRVLSFEQLVNLYNLAGFAVGVGDWRPEKRGSNGCFHVEA